MQPPSSVVSIVLPLIKIAPIVRLQQFAAAVTMGIVSVQAVMSAILNVLIRIVSHVIQAIIVLDVYQDSNLSSIQLQAPMSAAQISARSILVYPVQAKPPVLNVQITIFYLLIKPPVILIVVLVTVPIALQLHLAKPAMMGIKFPMDYVFPPVRFPTASFAVLRLPA